MHYLFGKITRKSMSCSSSPRFTYAYPIKTRVVSVNRLVFVWDDYWYLKIFLRSSWLWNNESQLHLFNIYISNGLFFQANFECESVYSVMFIWMLSFYTKIKLFRYTMVMTVPLILKWVKITKSIYKISFNRRPSFSTVNIA